MEQNHTASPKEHVIQHVNPQQVKIIEAIQEFGMGQVLLA